MLNHFVTAKRHMMIVNHMLVVMMYIVIINYKWIYFTCAKLKKTRKGQPWYCKYCKRKNNSKVDKTLSS